MISAIVVCAIVIAELINLDGPTWRQNALQPKYT
jgi:hypothetical protein